MRKSYSDISSAYPFYFKPLLRLSEKEKKIFKKMREDREIKKRSRATRKPE